MYRPIEAAALHNAVRNFECAHVELRRAVASGAQPRLRNAAKRHGEAIKHLFRSARRLSGTPPFVPGYWMDDPSTILRTAVTAYLAGDPLSDGQIAAVRDYLREWMAASAWIGEEADALTAEVELIRSNPALRQWLDRAANAGIDPI